MIRVELPYHLRVLAKTGIEVQLEVGEPVSQRTVLDALEAEFPILRGMIRDPQSAIRRPYLRIFACTKDLSHDSPDLLLPEPVATGAEPLIILGAVSGG